MCEHNYEFFGPCGAEVCGDCGDHKNLARCYCGWALSGWHGYGYTELVELGETIEPELESFESESGTL